MSSRTSVSQTTHNLQIKIKHLNAHVWRWIVCEGEWGVMGELCVKGEMSVTGELSVKGELCTYVGLEVGLHRHQQPNSHKYVWRWPWLQNEYFELTMANPIQI